MYNTINYKDIDFVDDERIQWREGIYKFDYFYTWKLKQYNELRVCYKKKGITFYKTYGSIDFNNVTTQIHKYVLKKLKYEKIYFILCRLPFKENHYIKLCNYIYKYFTKNISIKRVVLYCRKNKIKYKNTYIYYKLCINKIFDKLLNNDVLSVIQRFL
jgi:hypothetical protein